MIVQGDAQQDVEMAECGGVRVSGLVKLMNLGSTRRKLMSYITKLVNVCVWVCVGVYVCACGRVCARACVHVRACMGLEEDEVCLRVKGCVSGCVWVGVWVWVVGVGVCSCAECVCVCGWGVCVCAGVCV